jgi:hypothetical protein
MDTTNAIPSAPCSLPFALCPLLYALCSLHSATFPQKKKRAMAKERFFAEFILSEANVLRMTKLESLILVLGFNPRPNTYDPRKDQTNVLEL